MSAYIRVASANQNITVPQYWKQQVVSSSQSNIYYMDGNVGIGQAVPTSKLVVDGSTSIGYPTTAAPANGLIVSGNVGIGVTNPQAKLHVLDTNYFTAFFENSLASQPGQIIVRNNYHNNQIQIRSKFDGADNHIFTWNGSGFDKLMLNNILTTTPYFVGIGNTNPQFPLHVNGQVSTGINGYYVNSPGVYTYAGTYAVSIRAADWVWALSGFVTSSDTRIKTNIQDIDDGVALSQLRLLQPKTYEYIDKVQRGSDPVIGFIAQEVAEVLPRAVTKQKEIIPSIYTIAAVSDGVLTLEKEHGLVVGDKVKLIKEQGGEVVAIVKEVLSAMAFTVEDAIEDTRIFVYGKEVPDFHTLDKNAIFTIGVAAVQELDRQVQQLKAENASILERLAAIEHRLS